MVREEGGEETIGNMSEVVSLPGMPIGALLRGAGS